MGNGMGTNKKIPIEDLQFLKQNTSFTEKQIRQWYKGFMRDCPAGQLTKRKFVEVYASFFPSGNAEEFCSHVFRTFDKDNSGMIDFREFLLSINITSTGKPQEKLDWAFNMYDINGNGTVEKSEMVQIIKAIYNMLGDEANQSNFSPEARANEIFAKMDRNADNVLTKEEFVAACLADKHLYSMLLADEPPPS